MFFFIFCLNLLAEAGSGHCKEDSLTEVHPYAHEVSLASAQNNDAGQDHSDGHACHFGHCGHILPPAPAMKISARESQPDFIFPPPRFAWRPLASLFKPPIA